MSKVTSKPRRRLSPRKRLALFDEMTKRVDNLPPVKPAAAGKGRGWTREDLYADRLDQYSRS
jgi:hypothetical protein